MRILALAGMLLLAIAIGLVAPQGDAQTTHNVTHHVHHHNGKWSHFVRYELAKANVVEVVETE